MKENMRMEIIEWINDLLDEIVQPTYLVRVMAFSLLSAEIESWNNAPTYI
ncbi:hypothetical protein MUP77_16745 [Candidatus Bathyarchaeota archaeon]|nr:hypothetical protein [Candidatus Bathyarchaeota archaeon]